MIPRRIVEGGIAPPLVDLQIGALSLKTYSIEVERINPSADFDLPKRMRVQISPHFLNLEGRDILVQSIKPICLDSKNNNLAELFPFFNPKIISEDPLISRPTSGYLLSPIKGREDKNRFDSYYSAVEVILSPEID